MAAFSSVFRFVLRWLFFPPAWPFGSQARTPSGGLLVCCPSTGTAITERRNAPETNPHAPPRTASKGKETDERNFMNWPLRILSGLQASRHRDTRTEGHYEPLCRVRRHEIPAGVVQRIEPRFMGINSLKNHGRHARHFRVFSRVVRIPSKTGFCVQNRRLLADH